MPLNDRVAGALLGVIVILVFSLALSKRAHGNSAIHGLLFAILVVAAAIALTH